MFAVGGRALVNCLNGDVVVLTDEGGTSPLARIADGVEVEVLAWRPRPGATRYHVMSADRQLEGWVAGASLKARPPRPVPKLVSSGKPTIAPTLPVRSVRKTGARTRSAPALAKGAEIKIITRASAPRIGTR